MEAQSTATTPVPQAPQRRPLRRWLARHAWWFAPLVLIAGLMLVFWVQLRRIDARYQAALARLRTAGVPTNGAELNAFDAQRPVDPEATAAWLAAIDAWRAAGFTPAQEQLLSELAFPQEKPAVEEASPTGDPPLNMADLRSAMQPVLNAVRAAQAQGTAVRYPRDYRQGISTTLSFIQSLRRLAPVLLAEAGLQADAGNIDGAIAAVLATLQLSSTLQQERTVVAQFVRHAIVAQARHSTLALLANHSLSSPQLRELTRAYADIDFDDALACAIRGEMGLSLDSSVLRSVGGPRAYLFERLSLPGKLCLAEHFEQVLQAEKHPWPRRLLAVEQLVEVFDVRHDKMPAITRMSHMHCYLAPQMAIYTTAFARATAERDGLFVVLAACEWMNEHGGAMPESLEELAPEYLSEVPSDPYTGAPLRLKATDEEWTVYSVGENGRDDGGSAQGDASNRMLDIPTTLRFVPAQPTDAQP
ncbi:MAG: hypothetical protein K1X74_04615 [Pirellulales bacterium]|nr:hypothetical protein [Pirellulales bacterium]